MGNKRISEVLLIALCVSLSACNERVGIDDVISQYNYIALTPPSGVFVPGSFVYRENYDPDVRTPSSASLNMLCINRYAVDRYSYPPAQSPTETQNLRRFIGAEIGLSSDELAKQFGLHATARAARRISVRISDVSVEVYSLEDLWSIREVLGPRCREIINQNVGARNAYQIEQVLRASVDFVVEVDAELAAEARAEVARELGSLGIVVGGGSGASIRGESLIYGIRWNEITRPL